MAELLFEMWELVGRSREYPDKWRLCLITPIFKKGDEVVPENYRPVRMLSHARNIIEGAMGDAILRTTDFNAMQLGFQNGLSPIITLTDVNSMVNACFNKIKTLELAKSYYQVNRSILLEDCSNGVEKEINHILSACLKPLTVSTKGNVLKSTATQKIWMAQGSPLSTSIFLV